MSGVIASLKTLLNLDLASDLATTSFGKIKNSMKLVGGRKEGNAVLMFTNNQRRTIKTLERDVGCKFEFASPPTIEKVLESSA
ncbi:hypothetical protein TB2_002462 [Malus domestica]